MFRIEREQRNRMGTLRIILLLSLTSCAAPDWRHGNYYNDLPTGDKRHDHRDKITKRANNFREETAKHYINEHKKHDGKINLFKRDGFDWGF